MILAHFDDRLQRKTWCLLGNYYEILYHVLTRGTSIRDFEEIRLDFCPHTAGSFLAFDSAGDKLLYPATTLRTRPARSRFVSKSLAPHFSTILLFNPFPTPLARPFDLVMRRRPLTAQTHSE
jgi:hypothetical protein